jgi:chromosomal replication initiator protein
MVAEIEPPELETRVAILKARAESEHIVLTDEVAYLIANYVKSNVRELEGSLIKIAAHAAMYGMPITTELVKKVLRSYVAEKQRIISIDEIIATVAQFYGLKTTDLRGPSRKGPIAKARQVVMFLAREMAQLSASTVGQELGGRHHTSVLHGEQTIAQGIQMDGILKNQVRQIENQLTNRDGGMNGR